FEGEEKKKEEKDEESDEEAEAVTEAPQESEDEETEQIATPAPTPAADETESGKDEKEPTELPTETSDITGQSEILPPGIQNDAPTAEVPTDNNATAPWKDAFGWVHYPWKRFPIRKMRYENKKDCGCQVIWIKRVYKRRHPKPRLLLTHNSFFNLHRPCRHRRFPVRHHHHHKKPCGCRRHVHHHHKPTKTVQHVVVHHHRKPCHKKRVSHVTRVHHVKHGHHHHHRLFSRRRHHHHHVGRFHGKFPIGYPKVPLFTHKHHHHHHHGHPLRKALIHSDFGRIPYGLPHHHHHSGFPGRKPCNKKFRRHHHNHGHHGHHHAHGLFDGLEHIRVKREPETPVPEVHSVENPTKPAEQ
ncbi:hypothetical protein PENTCL1PPCAC_29896, partial [Pristionchus entomophagus]